MKATKTRRTRCKECEKLFPADEIYRGMCNGCEEDHVFCYICEKWHYRGEECRHLIYTSWGEYLGPGCGYDESDAIKESFFLFLDVLDSIQWDDWRDINAGWPARQGGMVDAITPFIEQDDFYGFFSGDMFSIHGWSFRTADNSNIAKISASDFEDRIEELDEKEESEIDWLEDWKDGQQWLQSLEDKRTNKANQITVSWIRQWRESRVKA